jgi:hypothetical protein
VKARPILFSAEMVCALLAGTKTQTRRIVKPQPPCGCEYVINGAYNAALCHSIERPEVWVPPTARSVDHRLPCPYGQPGDRLWVKETWCELDDGVDRPIAYRADNWTECPSADGKWRPSIFMSRAASRITLEITAVRVERLQEISEADAKAEGCIVDPWHYPCSLTPGKSTYCTLWESINGPGSWEANPWVWVIEFRRIAP